MYHGNFRCLTFVLDLSKSKSVNVLYNRIPVARLPFLNDQTKTEDSFGCVAFSFSKFIKNKC